jgi:hypothetical protein
LPRPTALAKPWLPIIGAPRLIVSDPRRAIGGRGNGALQVARPMADTVARLKRDCGAARRQLCRA